MLRRQLEDPDVRPGVRERVSTRRSSASAAAGFELVDVDIPELELVDDALGAIVLKEAYDVHRDLLEREGAGYGPGTRALLEAGREGRRRPPTRAGSPTKDRIAAGFARVFAEVDVLAGPTVAYPAPAEDPPFGTPEGDVEARFTGPYNLAGVPGGLGPVRGRRREPARRTAARGRGRARTSCCSRWQRAYERIAG